VDAQGRDPHYVEAHHRRLRDGTPVTVFRLSGEDAQRDRQWLRERINEGYEKLSSRSRRLRFVSPPHHLAPWQLDHLTDLDPGHSNIWVARVDAMPQPEGVGLARCMRLAEPPGAAEIALTVLDDYQNRGMGRIFLELLLRHARDQGLRLLLGYVLPENGPMLHLLESFGAREPVDEGGLLRVALPLGGEQPEP
jgi:GNAT superfamily N-acetyltransferase